MKDCSQSFKRNKLIHQTSIIAGIVATFVGTVVGAGFASGREIYQFFSIYGYFGWLGLILAVLLLGFAGVKVLQSGKVLKPKSYQEFLSYFLGPKWVPLFDVLLLIFWVVLIGIMFAGCGTIFETMHLNYWLGVIITSICLLIVLFRGLIGIVWINLIVVPFMLIGSIVIWISNTQNAPNLVPNNTDIKWILAALQFSTYNLVFAIPVLLSLGKNYPDTSQLKIGAWLGSLILGLMAGLIHGSIISNFGRVNQCPLPMTILAKTTGDWFYWTYILILWGEMFTTLIANTYGVAERLANTTRLPYRGWVLILTLIGIFISKLGFINLIARGYPLFGYLCIIILVFILLKPLPSSKIPLKKLFESGN